MKFSNSSIKNSSFSDQAITKSFSYYIDIALKNFNGMILRKDGRPIIGWLISKFADVGGKVSKCRVRLVVKFSFLLLSLMRSEGPKGTVLYLKTSHVLIQQAIAGYIVTDLSPLKRRVRRSRSGYPLWIPLEIRRSLSLKDIGMIRLVTSLCAIYRVIDFPGTLNLGSITDKGPALSSLPTYLLESMATTRERFWSRLNVGEIKKSWWNVNFEFFPIGKSNPQTQNTAHSIDPSLTYMHSRIIASTYWSIWASARIWLSKGLDQVPDILNIEVFLRSVKNFDWFMSNLWHVGADEYRKYLSDSIKKDFHKKYFSDHEVNPYLGKLGFKDEPAGKVRVFAMVDIWTQWLLFPLHKLIQSILRPLKEDATFDQLGRLESKLKEMSIPRKKKAFSFDLSSATDRLPVVLQVYLLQPLLGKGPAAAWANILVNRGYFISKRNAEKYNIPEGSRVLAYAVGQPMGALSSWVMLALTHHFIVQWAFYDACSRKLKRLKGFWFTDYLVLGDDIVIFDSFVAESYRKIMDLLGVKIGLAKSISAKSSWTLEFAKKYFVDGEKANMVPVRDIIVTTLSTGVLFEFLSKHDLTFQHYLKVRGLGYKARSKVIGHLWNLPNRLRVYIVEYQRSIKESWLDWVTMKSLSSNYILTKPGLIRLIWWLKNHREDSIRPRLIRLEAQIQSEHNFLRNHPYFMVGSHSSVEALDAAKLILDDFTTSWFSGDIEEVEPLESMDLPTLRDMACELKEDNDHWSEVTFGFKNLTWYTQAHTEEGQFIDLLSVYKTWVICNSFFVNDKVRKPAADENVCSDAIDALSIDSAIPAESEIKPLVLKWWDYNWDNVLMKIDFYTIVLCQIGYIIIIYSIWTLYYSQDPEILLSVDSRLWRPSLDSEPSDTWILEGEGGIYWAIGFSVLILTKLDEKWYIQVLWACLYLWFSLCVYSQVPQYEFTPIWILGIDRIADLGPYLLGTDYFEIQPFAVYVVLTKLVWIIYLGSSWVLGMMHANEFLLMRQQAYEQTIENLIMIQSSFG